MDSTVSRTSPKFPQDFTLVEVEGDDASVGRLLQEPARQPRPGRDEIRPRGSHGLVRLLIIFSVGVCTSLAWQWYGYAARAMIATSWPQLASLAPDAPVLQVNPELTASLRDTVSPELRQLREDLAQLKQELQQLKEMPAALASLRRSVDRLAGSQQEIAGTVAKPSTQKPAAPLRPAPTPKPVTPPQLEVR